MGTVDFHGVEPGFFGAPGGFAELSDDDRDFFLRQDVNRFFRIGDGAVGRSHHGQSADGTPGFAARVMNLNGNFSALGVDGVGETPEAGNLVVVVNAHSAAEALTLRRDIGGFQRVESHSAAGSFGRIGDETVGDESFLGREAGHHGGIDDAVAQFHVAETRRFKTFHDGLSGWRIKKERGRQGCLAPLRR